MSRFSREMTAIIGSDDFRRRMAEVGAEPVGNTPAEMARQIDKDTRRFAVLVRDGKVAID